MPGFEACTIKLRIACPHCGRGSLKPEVRFVDDLTGGELGWRCNNHVCAEWFPMNVPAILVRDN